MQRSQVLRHLQGECRRLFFSAISPRVRTLTDPRSSADDRRLRRESDSCLPAAARVDPSDEHGYVFARRKAFAWHFLRPRETDTALSTAAKAIGSEELEKKFNDSLACLERPSSVAFAASLVSSPRNVFARLEPNAEAVPFFSTFERRSALDFFLAYLLGTLCLASMCTFYPCICSKQNIFATSLPVYPKTVSKNSRQARYRPRLFSSQDCCVCWAFNWQIDCV